MGNRGVRGHGPLGADRCRHLILGIGRRVGVSSRFWPGFMSHWRGDPTVTEAALVHHVGVLHAHPAGSVLVIHTSPHVGHAHTGGSHAWVVVLKWTFRPWESVSHRVHAVALRTMMGWIHAGLRRRARMEADGTGAQRGSVGGAHVAVLLLVRGLLLVRI